MSEKHTPGLLVAEELDQDADYTFVIRQIDGDPYPLPVADCNCQADARRLVACWNACEGIETYALELMTGDLSIKQQITATGSAKPPKPTSKAVEYRRQRDELVAALEKIAGFTLSQFMGPHDMALECVTVACAAIAKVEGGAA